MNILRPVRFDGYMPHGGSTKPWRVYLLEEEDKEAPYVVKLFTSKNIEQQHSVAKEVYGNVLAREFSLPVPDYALVDFDSNFINYGLETPERDILIKKDQGLKFASKLYDNKIIVTSALYKNYLKEYELANVFAFDCLIYNVDRGGFNNKNNLLVDDEGFLLIDHELSFPFADNEIGYFNKIMNDFDKDKIPYLYQKHLFYAFLKELRPQDKKHAFDEFEEYLSKLKLDNFELAINELKRFNVSVGYYERIIEYLYKLHKFHSRYISILLSCIS